MKWKTQLTLVALCLALRSNVYGEVVVMKGDTLWSISVRELGSGTRWKEIVKANNLEAPFTISPGQILVLPGEIVGENVRKVEPRAVAPLAVTPPFEAAALDDGKGGSFQVGTGLSSMSSVPSSATVVMPPAGMSRDLAGQTLKNALDEGEELDIPTLSDQIIRAGVPVKLETLVQIALERNLPLLSGRISTRSAEADILGALAAFDPDFSISAEQEYAWATRYAVTTPVRTRTSSFSTEVSGTLSNSTEYSLALSPTRTRVNPQTGIFDANYENSYTLSLTQPLLKGMGRRIAYADVEIAQLESKASQEELEDLVEATISSVENAYWALLEAEAAEQVARNSRDVARQLAVRNLELFKRGLSSELSVVTAKQGLAQREASLTKAHQGRMDRVEEIIFLVYGQSAAPQLRSSGREIQTIEVVVTPPKLPSVDQAIDEALAARSDIAGARRDLERTLVSRMVTRNALLPDLSLTGSLTQGNTSSSFDFQASGRLGERADNSWSAGVVLSIPIGHNSAQASHQKALLDVEAKRIALETTEANVREDVRKTLRAVNLVARQLEQAEAAAALSFRQLDGERKLLDLGLTDTFKVLQVEEQSANARLSAIQAKSSLAKAITDYQRSIGRVAEKYFPNGVASSR